MNRRDLLQGIAGSSLIAFQSKGATASNVYLELKTWRLHNSEESQPERVSKYLENGLRPALARAGVQFIGAFGNVIGPDGPYYVTLTQYASLAEMQDALTKLAGDQSYQHALGELASGSAFPFVRVESSLLRTFDVMPQPKIGGTEGKTRIFELRTYESPNFSTLARKIGMFNNGEAGIFERLGMRPVFFGETIIGARQPSLTYMLSFDSLAERDRLWSAFGSDPEWKKLSSEPQLKDSEIVSNISNVILRPMPFSAIR